MDKIIVKGLKIFAHHGVLQFEKENGQEFPVDITLWLDTQSAGISDDLSQTVNYDALSKFAAEKFCEKSYDLIEAAAEMLSFEILKKYELVKEVTVCVHKPGAPISVPFDDVSVTISRRWHTAFVAVGSNMGDSAAIIERGIDKLNSRLDTRVVVKSPLHVTKPYGEVKQSDFLNGMLKIETLLSPENLLNVLNDIEASEGRERIVHWGPRTLDLDIIYYDRMVINTKRLTVPHADMCNREFVLLPLSETDPFVRHPVNGLTAGEMLANLRR